MEPITHEPNSREFSEHSLESAIQTIERGLRPNGKDDVCIPEGEQAGFEWRLLFRWAEEAGAKIPHQIVPEREGGREHDVTFLAGDGLWMKFTKPDGCGLYVDFADGQPILLPATPLQYLNRLKMQNLIWGDEIKLLGVQVKCPGARIVTSQPDITGEPPEAEELDARLQTKHGFRRLNIPPMGYYKSFSYMRGNLGMFDVHPAIFVKLRSQNWILPIDVIMIEFSEEDAASLKKFL